MIKSVSQVSQLSLTEAISTLVEMLRDGSAAKYGYDLEIDNIVHSKCSGINGDDKRHAMEALSRKLYDASWELCVRGIVRPGIRDIYQQTTSTGGYTLTQFGRRWLKESQTDSLIVSDFDRVSKLIEQYRRRFGEGFFQRGVEAVRCYHAHAYLAACSMAGAAAESITLALAIAKKGDENEVLKLYVAAQGRSKIENLLIGQIDDRIKRSMQGFLGLLKDWRDEASHGTATNISGEEAATSLDLLVRFASFADKYWDTLTSP